MLSRRRQLARVRAAAGERDLEYLARLGIDDADVSLVLREQRDPSRVVVVLVVGDPDHDGAQRRLIGKALDPLEIGWCPVAARARVPPHHFDNLRGVSRPTQSLEGGPLLLDAAMQQRGVLHGVAGLRKQAPQMDEDTLQMGVIGLAERVYLASVKVSRIGERLVDRHRWASLVNGFKVPAV